MAMKLSIALFEG